VRTEVRTLIIGSGIAGLFAALRAASLGSVMLVTKASLSESNTRYAQGGIAAVLFPDDSIESHIADTLAAGAGLCNEDAVRVLCSEGPARIHDLLSLGVAFDRDASGAGLARGMEAAHASARVIHAGGDATGLEVQRGLEAAVRAAGVTIREHTYLTDLITTDRSVRGARFVDTQNAELTVFADATILATGGAGQTFRFTTNPRVATGDGVAAAFRAGAAIADAEMYQFHPTLLTGPRPFLVSEAVRGEGAVLRNARGERFMLDRHPMAELAPRDVVARAIAEEIANQDGQPVLLDATAFDATFLARRFPTIDQHCRAMGLDWSETPIPVTPAAHFWMGGVLTDTWGRTSLDRLYAIGEVASSGVHGANRLASNSLLEGLVFGDRAVRGLAGDPARPPRTDPEASVAVDLRSEHDETAPGFGTEDLRRLAWDELGLVRNAHGLRVADKQLALWVSALTESRTPGQREARNLLTVARLIATSASLRQESRGAHFRSDYPLRAQGAPAHTVIAQLT
jgi:L-aspartate oxidase